MINCESCGVVPVNIKDLPIQLPQDVDFSIDGNPLFNHPTWRYTKCPKCGGDALRECDTFDTFFESSWYFLRFATMGSNKPFDEDLIKYWLPVDQYIGGIEHAVMHLLYARFFVKALSYVGILDKLSEPFVSLMTQGMICHKTYKNSQGNWIYPSDVVVQGDKLIDKNTSQEVFAGKIEKMSKSKKNIVDPAYICSIYGADTARLFVLSDSPPQRDLEWSDEGVEGTYKFINRLWNFVVNNYNKDDKTILQYYNDNNPNKYLNIGKLDEKALSIYKYLNKTLLEIELNIKDFHFNKAIALCRELFNHLDENKLVLAKHGDLNNLAIAVLLQNIGFFIPHLAEELWQYMGFTKFLFNCPYFNYNESFVASDTFIVAIQISGKTRASIELKSNEADITSEDLLEKVKQIDNIAKHLQDKEIKKVIYVPKKIINLVC
jgi:leucyl-tRNA synthetase